LGLRVSICFFGLPIFLGEAGAEELEAEEDVGTEEVRVEEGRTS